MVGLAAPGRIVNATTALQICLLFGGASLMSIGGGNSVVPEIELQAVGAYHWLSEAQFAFMLTRRPARSGTSNE